MISILIVCTGNICRSPALAAALQKIINENGLSEKVYVDSCGVTSWFLGAPADPRMVAIAHQKGIDIKHKAKLFEEGYFELFDYILAVDQGVLKMLQIMAVTEANKSKLHLASEFSTAYKDQEMPDPYYNGEAQFNKIMDMTQEIAQNIYSKIILGKV
jgi:protein-tyrosine phosphatase